MLCGSGELGKEVVIELERYGVEAIACDAYENAPAMQVEAIATDTLAEIEKEGLEQPDTQLRLFGKPRVAGKRRMAVGLARGTDVENARVKARGFAGSIEVSLRALPTLLSCQKVYRKGA